MGTINYIAQEPPFVLACVFRSAQLDSAWLFFLALNVVLVVPIELPGYTQVQV